MNVGPPGVVIIPPGWVRCVVTNVGPTLVRIVPVVVDGEVGQGAVTGGAVRADPQRQTAGAAVSAYDLMCRIRYDLMCTSVFGELSPLSVNLG